MSKVLINKSIYITIIYPWTMMIHLHYTSRTGLTMLELLSIIFIHDIFQVYLLNISNRIVF